MEDWKVWKKVWLKVVDWVEVMDEMLVDLWDEKKVEM